MPSPLALRWTKQQALLAERKYIVNLWLENDPALVATVQKISRDLIVTDRNKGLHETIRRPWSHLCDWAGHGESALVAYTNDIADAVRAAGLRPAAVVGPRDFLFNAYVHAHAWFLVSGVKGVSEFVTEDSYPVSPGVDHLTIDVSLRAWNPQQGIDHALRQMLAKVKELERSEWREWRPPERRADLSRQAGCLFLRLNRRLTVPKIATEIIKNGWPVYVDAHADPPITADQVQRWQSEGRKHFAESDVDVQRRTISRHVSVLAKNHGLRYTKLRQP